MVVTFEFSKIQCASFFFVKTVVTFYDFKDTIKIPRGSSNINLGDIVYYMSPRGVINLSRKLTLRWTGPYKVTGAPTESLSVINPIGNWAVNKRELHVLTSRLRKVDPAYYKPVNEQIFRCKKHQEST